MKAALLLASAYGATGVILGAFGAHALKEKLTEYQLASWETGVRYQLIHALGLSLKPTVWLWAVGTTLFSGSIYLLSLEMGPKALWGPITPIGGLCLIFGWGWLFISAAKL